MLQSIESWAVEIPFKLTFSHAAASRAATQSVWVEARDHDGLVGCGEGCPREYVTHETLDGAIAFVTAQRDALMASIRDIDALRAWVRAHRPAIDANPAAWCALELALVDLIAKRNGQTVDALLGLPALSGSFSYTAVIGDASPRRFDAELGRYLETGLRDFKIKLSGDAAKDKAKVAALKAAGVDPASVRADANNLWTDAERAIHFISALDFPFNALEEPLRAGDIEGMQRIADALACSIVLDESLLRCAQLDRLADSRARWIVNLRVSKMGGLLRSLELLAAARATGLRVNVGAHVGETSLLTRAALSVANAARDILVAQEGAFGTHLLAHDVVEAPLMFGAGGVLDSSSLAGPGFGLSSSTAGCRLRG